MLLIKGLIIFMVFNIFMVYNIYDFIYIWLIIYIWYKIYMVFNSITKKIIKKKVVLKIS